MTREEKAQTCTKRELSRTRILVVDDDNVSRRVMSEGLRRKGYTVDDAADCSEALPMLGATAYDLLLTDVEMPGMQGTELLTHCRQHRPDMAVILITGTPRINDAVQSIKNGALDYLTKSTSLKALLDQVAEALRKRAEATARMAATVVANENVPGTDFKTVELLGQGTSGSVFLVEKDGRKYALKILRTWGGVAGRGVRDDVVARFLREVEILEKLEHPFIVRTYGHSRGNAQRAPYMLLEYVPGRDLSVCIMRKELDLVTKLRMLTQIAQGLAAVHALDIVHRDLKPANVLVTDDLTPKLTDFGIASLAGSTLTATGMLLGSPSYLAPETLVGESPTSVSDLFSLGVMGYELITGMRPFRADSIPALAYELTHSLPTAPKQRVPELPDSINDLLMWLLQKEPGKRCPTAREAADRFAAECR